MVSSEECYHRSDMTFTMPGLQDEMTVWKDGGKERMRKYNLTLFLRETFFNF